MSEAVEVVAPAAEKIDGPEAFAKLARTLCNPDQETLVVVSLDCRSKVLNKHVAGLGTVDNVSVVLRDVFREAVRCNAFGIAVAHNHPSGDCTPSGADVQTAKAVIRGANLLGIQVADVAVVTLGDDPKYVSIMRLIMEEQVRDDFARLPPDLKQLIPADIKRHLGIEEDEDNADPAEGIFGAKAKKEVLPS